MQYIRIMNIMNTTGWWYTYPSEKYESVGIIIPNIWENKKCSKPPTRQPNCNIHIWLPNKQVFADNRPQ